MTKPVNRVFCADRDFKSKEEVTWELDDMPKDAWVSLPQEIQTVLKGAKTKKAGRYIRNNHPEVFERYYERAIKEPRRVD